MSINAENNSSSVRKLNRRNFLQYGTVITGGLMASPYLANAEIIMVRGA